MSLKVTEGYSKQMLTPNNSLMMWTKRWLIACSWLRKKTGQDEYLWS